MSCSSAASRSTRSGPGTGAVGSGLQRDRLVEHHERVLVDVLVAVVLVDLEPQRGQLGQHVVGQPGVDQHLQARARVRREQQLAQLVAHPLGRDDRDALGHVDDRRARVGVDREPQLGGEPGGPHHAQRVVVERLPRVDRGAQHAGARGRRARRTGRRTSAPARRTAIALTVKSRRDRSPSRVSPNATSRLARRRVVLVGAVRGDLDDDVLRRDARRPANRRAPIVPNSLPMSQCASPHAREQRLGLVRASPTS